MIILPASVILTFLFFTINDGRRIRRVGCGNIELARSNIEGRGRGSAARYNRNGGRRGGRGDVGRKRYNRDGLKKRRSSDDIVRQEEISPLPPLTEPNGKRPSYFTCRHTFENTLIKEINRSANQLGGCVVATSPYPGLVRVEDDVDLLPTYYDPVYALQSIPNCVIISAESIKGIAKEAIRALLGDESDDTFSDETSTKQRENLREAKRGTLAVHSLVPGMCKGQMKPVMQHRSEKVGEEMVKILKKMFPAARKAAIDEAENGTSSDERWIIQMMLQSPNIALASLTKCESIGPGRKAYWPNYYHPLGLAKVDIEEKMPSSAYRKLMEGLECMGVVPGSSTTVVDLGACPGGWTQVIRRLGCKVVAVDRSALDPVLMRDEMVDFIKGDAFTFEPTMVTEKEDCWMISDVIAYPDRCTDLINQWCAEQWASHMVITMKFQGNDPDLDELQKAIQIVEKHGYHCRVKHFFNNKNEVTFMISEKGGKPLDLDSGNLGSAMFPVTLQN